ncbi:hypothetical protein RJ45_11415 [Photobacterium gaetbulicola]|uniref:WYL domain-containing protein n=1 Tax=Photobacterium gaetbulicola TaxID=1295392 RepID=A0A0B9H3T7_9GAMM|nr:WYL domain-containing protein [Photobacterium gaetbulicola]KHT63552.1 hypothetical protein RJ45_11415 [Photobacterium gaetbulicola]
MCQKSFGDFYCYLHCLKMLQSNPDGVTPKDFLASVKKESYFHKYDASDDAQRLWAGRILEGIYNYHGIAGDAPRGQSDLIIMKGKGNSARYKVVSGEALSFYSDINECISPLLLLEEQLENLFLPKMGEKLKQALYVTKKENAYLRYSYCNDTYDVVNPVVDNETLAKVEAALERKKVLSFSYNGYQREVDPYGLFVYGKVFYLIAKERKSEKATPSKLEYKTYALHRINKLEFVTSAHFSMTLGKEFSLGEHLSSQAGKFFNGGESVDVTLKMKKDSEGKNRFVDEFKLSDCQTTLEDGQDYYLVKAKARDCLDFRKFLLKNTYYMELLSPKNIRDDVVREIKQAAQAYSA